MERNEPVEQTVLIFFQVTTPERRHHYQASVLRTSYHGARPGDEVVHQIEHVGYVCAIEPGTRVQTVKELRAPRGTREEVEAEIRSFLTKRHGVSDDDVVEAGRHVFTA